MNEAGLILLQALAERVLARWLERQGNEDVTLAGIAGMSASVDVSYRTGGVRRTAKVKPDAYFGRDAALLGDRTLEFYRPEGDTYSFEVVADSATRESGWALRSNADDLFYYMVAIAQPPAEVAALMDEPDPVFFGELKVDRDALSIIPMRAFTKWFGEHYEDYAPRPVAVGGRSAWHRIVPKRDVGSAVQGVRTVSPVFSGLWP